MREKAFRDYLVSREMSEDKIIMQIAFVHYLEGHIKQLVPSWTLEDLNGACAQSIVDDLIDRGENSLENLLAIARYAKAVQNEPLYGAIFSMLDGCQAMERLYDQLGLFAGEDLRDMIFEDMPLPPVGISRREKSRYTYRLIKRMEDIFEESTTREILKDSLHILPDEMYLSDKNSYFHECQCDIDHFLKYKTERFIEALRSHRDSGELYLGQEIDNDVIEYVRANPQIVGGVRQGDVILETKMPYNTKAYLIEKDPDKKRYHYCHCPWARESLLERTFTVSPTFCQCSAGFHKKPYEIIFEQPIEAEVLQSVLNGDFICQFAIHLPE